MPKNREPEILIRDNLIVKHLAGSRAYGTSRPDSDTDLRGVFCADPINILTPWHPIKETEVDHEDDTKLYELRHFMNLILGNNPNILETLWVDEDDIMEDSEVYWDLREARSRFLTRDAGRTFTGYAFNQLDRMKGHNKWINNPQSERMPQHIDFISLVQWFGPNKVLPRDFNIRDYCDDWRLVPYGGHIYGLYVAEGFRSFDPHNGALKRQFDGDRHSLMPPMAVVKFRFGEYKRAKKQHRQYWTWKKERNPKRAILEEKYGYDTKNALHLVRLLRMGVEILQTGQVNVKRPDADELLEILDGQWSYEEVLKYAEMMNGRIKILMAKTDLPPEPDFDYAADLLMAIQETIWGFSDG